MNATSSAAAYAPLAGADLEAELAQARVSDDEARDAAIVERDGGGSVLPLARRRAGSPAPDDAVTLSGVSKRFGARTVLDNVELGIARGSFVAIVGRSGCGNRRCCVSSRASSSRAAVRWSRAAKAAAGSTRGSCTRMRVCCRGRPCCKT